MRSWSEVGSRVWCDMHGSFVHSEDNSGALNDSQSYLSPTFLRHFSSLKSMEWRHVCTISLRFPTMLA